MSAKQEKQTLGIGAGRPGPGRKKGVPNKMTMAAKEAVAFAAEGLGGAQRLIDWAKEDPVNEKAFWTQIYTKLIPLQVGADPDAPLMGVVMIPMKDSSSG